MMDTGNDFKEGWVTVGGVPTHVCTYGGWIETDKCISPDNNKNGIDKKRSLILFLCGNPGVIKFYHTFLLALYKKLLVPIWILSHAGHELPPKDSKTGKSIGDSIEMANVASQVVHKAEFIKQYICDKDIYIIGHSFGAKVAVELLKQELFSKQIKKCYLIFPTLERFSDTINGKFLQWIIKYFYTITLLFALVFSMLSYSVRWWLIKSYFFLKEHFNFPPNCVDATIDLVNPTVLKNVFDLANDEMTKIQDLDKEVIEENVDKLQVFFGAKDGWAPVEYHKNLIHQVPKIDSIVLDRKYEHCFVFKTADEFASELSQHIKSDLY